MVSPDDHECWTNTLRVIASIILRNRDLPEPVDVRWVWTQKTAGEAYQNLSGWRIIRLAHLVYPGAIVQTFFHELGHHIAGHCQECVDDPTDEDIEHPVVYLQGLIDENPASAAVNFLPSVQDKEAQANAWANILRTEFEAEHGPLLRILTS